MKKYSSVKLLDNWAIGWNLLNVEGTVLDSSLLLTTVEFMFPDGVFSVLLPTHMLKGI